MLKVLWSRDRLKSAGRPPTRCDWPKGWPPHQIEAAISRPTPTAVAPCRRERLPLSIYPRLSFPDLGPGGPRVDVRELAADPPDLIHVQSWSMYPFGAWLARRLERPYVLGVHGYLPSHVRVPFDRRWGRRIIAVSQSVEIGTC